MNTSVLPIDERLEDELFGVHQLHNKVRVAPAPLPNFDFGTIKKALMQSHRIFDGTPVAEDEADNLIQDYRIFLQDCKNQGMPEGFSPPSRQVDRVWHCHMCETKQYAQDCDAYFGTLLHHSFHTCEGPRN